jgi:hypothetical protein
MKRLLLLAALAAATAVSAKPNTPYFVTSSGPGGTPDVKRFDPNSMVFWDAFLSYDPGMRLGVEVATGRVVETWRTDVVTGASEGAGPHVRVFNGNGGLLAEFFAYDPNFRGGVFVATGDVDGDGYDEVITAPGRGGSPHIRVWKIRGGVHLINEFAAYDWSFQGGVRLGAGDVTRDGIAEIVTAPGPGGGPHIRVFNRFGGEVHGYIAPVPVRPWDGQHYTNGYRVTVGSDPWGTPELYVSGSEWRFFWHNQRWDDCRISSFIVAPQYVRKAYWVLSPYVLVMRIPDGASLARFHTEWLNTGFLGNEVSYPDYLNVCAGGCNVFTYPYQNGLHGPIADYSVQTASLQQAGAHPRLLVGNPYVDQTYGGASAGCTYDSMFAPGVLKLYERWGQAVWSSQPYGNMYGGVRPATNN